MIETNTHRFVARIFAGLVFNLFRGGVIMMMAPLILIAPYLAFAARSTLNFFRCAYISERFSEYTQYSLRNTLAFIYFLSYILITYSLHYEFSHELYLAMIESPLLLLPLCAAHAYAYLRSKFINPFHTRYMYADTMFNPMLINHPAPILIIGVITAIFKLTKPQILQYEYGLTATTILAYAFLFLLLRGTYPTISGLKQLKKQEAREKCEFTFYNIDEIRAFRTSSVVAICALWINNHQVLLKLKKIIFFRERITALAKPRPRT